MLRNRPLIVVNGIENVKEIFVKHAYCASDRPVHHYMTIMAKIDKGRKVFILLEPQDVGTNYPLFPSSNSIFWHNTDKGDFILIALYNLC